MIEQNHSKEQVVQRTRYLAEAVTQFQALAYKELLPAEGPVRTQIIGMPTPDKEAQSTKSKTIYELSNHVRDARVRSRV